YIDTIRSALRHARTPPAGPVLIGLPQDVAETTWLPLTALRQPAHQPSARPPIQAPSPEQLNAAAGLLAASERILVLIDDYLLRHDQAKSALAAFTSSTRATVMQARYRRGAMLFERLRTGDVPGFLGWYDPAEPRHRKLMDSADLLVTIEDRNL